MALILGTGLFAVAGAILALLVGFLLRLAGRRLPRIWFVAIVMLLVLALEFFLLAILGAVVESRPISFGFLVSMRWQLRFFFAASLVTAAVVGGIVAPKSALKVKSETFE